MNEVLARQRFDRRLYRTVAICFTLVVFVGFARTYYAKALFGTPALASPLVHLHGLLMTAWVGLFASQVWLISSRQVRLHQRLGYTSIGLVAVIIGVGFVTAVRAAKYGAASTPPGISPLAFLAVPLFDLLMFALLFGGAVYYRKRPAAHKSLMLLTAINLLPPAVGRIPLPAMQALGPVWFFGVPTVLALLCLGLDWRRRGGVNRVLAGGVALLIASYVARLAVMGTGPWTRFATWLTSFV
jgi:hypothetical protein